MSCQARKEKKKSPFSLVPRDCRVSSEESSPRAPGAHYREAGGAGFPGTRPASPAPTWALGRRPPLRVRSPRPAAPSPAPPAARCRLQTRSAGSISIRDAPSLSFPCLSRFCFEVARGWRSRNLGRSWGEKPARIFSPCCVTLESFPALSGRGSHKWKCGANQTRCDYF